jgi:hypothetical protein
MGLPRVDRNAPFRIAGGRSRRRIPGYTFAMPTSMPTSAPWLSTLDPTTRMIVAGMAALVGLIILASIVRRFRTSRENVKRSRWLQQERARSEKQQAEMSRLAESIIATSSTANIAGYEIERQIDAVFAEGHKSPTEAMVALKSVAALKGANALINVSSDRLGTGKCLARGDAVVVHPLDQKAPNGTGNATGGE